MVFITLTVYALQTARALCSRQAQTRARATGTALRRCTLPPRTGTSRRSECCSTTAPGWTPPASRTACRCGRSHPASDRRTCPYALRSPARGCNPRRRGAIARAAHSAESEECGHIPTDIVTGPRSPQHSAGTCASGGVEITFGHPVWPHQHSAIWSGPASTQPSGPAPPALSSNGWPAAWFRCSQIGLEPPQGL